MPLILTCGGVRHVRLVLHGARARLGAGKGRPTAPTPFAGQTTSTAPCFRSCAMMPQAGFAMVGRATRATRATWGAGSDGGTMPPPSRLLAACESNPIARPDNAPRLFAGDAPHYRLRIEGHQPAMLHQKVDCRRRLGAFPVQADQAKQALDEPGLFRSALPNRTFIVRQVWTAASL